MSIRIDDPEGTETPLDRERASTSTDQSAAREGGTAANGHRHPGQAASCHDVGGRRVTPETVRHAPAEAPEERAERVRHTRAVLESLRATTPEEVEEQRETLKMLDKALSEGRPHSERLFLDDE
jgi:hypothetical protein